MFKTNAGPEQRKLFSFIQNMPDCVKNEVYGSFAPEFFENIFLKIDEGKFKALYSDKYSRPNKPVNVLVSLEVIKQIFGYTDLELIAAFHTDLRIMCAVGVEDPGDVQLVVRTLYNFRERVVEYDRKHGTSLIKEVLNDISKDLIDKFDIDISLQRMDSSMIEANIKIMTRLNLFVKVIYNFLKLIDKDIDELPEELQGLAEKENLDLSHRLKGKAAGQKLEEIAKNAYLLHEKYKDNDEYKDTKQFRELHRLIKEQFNITDDKDPEATLKRMKDVSSSSLQSPNDPDATYSFKNQKHHSGYVGNFAESCARTNPFQVITDVDVKPNNISDKVLLSQSLKEETSLVPEAKELLVDGGYSAETVEKECENAGIEIHLSGIRGKKDVKHNQNLADAVVEGKRLIRCPEGSEPIKQKCVERQGKATYLTGQFDKKKCLECPILDECFIKINKTCASFRFKLREYEVKKKRKKLEDTEYRKFLNLRAGVESLVYMIFYKSGKRTIYTGLLSVKNGILYRAIGVNLLRLCNFLKKNPEKRAKIIAISLFKGNTIQLFSFFQMYFRILRKCAKSKLFSPNYA